jgi:hypothetical protein
VRAADSLTLFDIVGVSVVWLYRLDQELDIHSVWHTAKDNLSLS